MYVHLYRITISRGRDYIMDESAAGLGCVVKAIAVLMVAVVIGARATLVHKTIQVSMSFIQHIK